MPKIMPTAGCATRPAPTSGNLLFMVPLAVCQVMSDIIRHRTRTPPLLCRIDLLRIKSAPSTRTGPAAGGAGAPSSPRVASSTVRTNDLLDDRPSRHSVAASAPDEPNHRRHHSLVVRWRKASAASSSGSCDGNSTLRCITPAWLATR
jgi:hypothetical protein